MSPIPEPIYRCPSCSLPVQAARLVSAVQVAGKLEFQFYCPCAPDRLRKALFPSSFTAQRALLGKNFQLPYQADPAPLTPDEIDRAVELFAFDLDGVDSVSEFDWLCQVKRGA